MKQFMFAGIIVITVVMLLGLDLVYFTDYYFKGRIIDDETTEPISGAEVFYALDLASSTITGTVFTNADGYFKISEEYGSTAYTTEGIELTITNEGYLENRIPVKSREWKFYAGTGGCINSTPPKYKYNFGLIHLSKSTTPTPIPN